MIKKLNKEASNPLIIYHNDDLSISNNINR